MLRLYLRLEKRGILLRNDRLVLLLEEVGVWERRVAVLLRVILEIPFILLRVVILVFAGLLLVPIRAVLDMSGLSMLEDLSARFEWWKREQMKEDEARRLGKKELTEPEEQALEKQVK
jgi:hypothetical protein